ncbi:hypothetical protein ACFFWD_15250 [Bradyrhizobium erythrophlei]|uniref:hypothetical protein n=1 Tax=Bradyrhizobium erythrophlei TaxID=1437360 RepID=UPI0035EA113D
MAKDPDKLAADFETEDTGGFLAEEDPLDRRALWRLGSWGVGAVGAVTIAVMANQNSLSFKRDQLAAADVARQAQQLQMLAKESHNEARRLASAIDTLNSDRDRLYSRVSTLEQGLDSVTGAITKQATAPAPPAAVASPAPVAPVADPAPAPAVAPVTTTPPPAPEKPAAADKPTAPTDKAAAAPADKKPATDKPSGIADRPAAPADKPAPVATVAPADALPPAATSAPPDAAKDLAKDPAKSPVAPPSPPLVASKSMMAPPDPAAGKLIEPVRPATANDVAASAIPDVALDPDSQVDEATAPKAKIQRTEFGVDLGTANSVNGLRALWRGLLKSKANAPLAALQPIIVIRESTNGLGMQLRLVAGPLNDAGTAARICAGLSPNQRTCDTAIYDGQRLTLKADDSPAAGKPVPQHRRVTPKRAVAPPPAEEPKKPEPTTFSSMFRRNSQ